MSVDWNACYHSGETPWEKGEPHPELPFLLSGHREVFSNASAILVPGCGVGHDAAAIAKATPATVTGLDLAEGAIALASSRHADSPVSWKVGDLFTWQGRFDLVFEHTCFCAIPPDRRADYASTMGRLIPPGGYLVGIFFLNPDHEGEEGPPFGVSVEELKDYFEPDFDLEWSRQPQRTYEGREGDGRELAMIWKRRS